VTHHPSVHWLCHHVLRGTIGRANVGLSESIKGRSRPCLRGGSFLFSPDVGRRARDPLHRAPARSTAASCAGTSAAHRSRLSQRLRARIGNRSGSLSPAICQNRRAHVNGSGMDRPKRTVSRLPGRVRRECCLAFGKRTPSREVGAPERHPHVVVSGRRHAPVTRSVCRPRHTDGCSVGKGPRPQGERSKALVDGCAMVTPAARAVAGSCRARRIG
jgi:hypothetical protein